MAIANPTQLGTITNSSGTPTTSGSVSPPADSIIFAFVGASSGSSFDIEEITSTFDGDLIAGASGETWHLINKSDPGFIDHTYAINNTNFGSNNAIVAIYWARTNSSPSSGTVSVNFNIGPSETYLGLAYITTDVHLTDPLVQYLFTGTGTSGTSHTDDLPSAPATTSMLLSCAIGVEAFADFAISEDTSWTELDDAVANSYAFNIQYRTGTTATQFGASFDTTVTNGIAIGCVEIRETQDSVGQPEILQEHQFATSGSSHTVPETGSVTVTADAWVFVGITVESPTTARTVDSVTSTFDIQGSWTEAIETSAVGNDNVVVAWYYAQVASSGTLSGTVTVNLSGSANHIGAQIIQIDDSNITGIGETHSNTQSGTLAADTEFTGTFTTSPAASSRILTQGMGCSGQSAGNVKEKMGWYYLGPPADEGSNQTSYQTHRIAGDDTYGGTLGSVAQSDGVAWAAIEVTGSFAGAANPKGALDLPINGPFGGPV